MENIGYANQINYQNEPLKIKNIDFYNDKEIQIIQQNCIQMGFDLNMVNKIIVYYNIRRQEEIIDYLLKDENGLWNHPFIPSLSEEKDINNDILPSNSLISNNKIMTNILTRVNSINAIKDNIVPNKEDICEICGENKLFHRIQNFNINDGSSNNLLSADNNDDILNYNNTNLNENNENNNILNEKIKNENECPICLDEFENPIEIEPCKHKLCQECFSSYLTDLIIKNNIDNIPCPIKKCENKSISENFFSQFISEQIYFKYRQFKAQNEIAKDPKKFFCPHCDSFALIEDDLEKYNNNSPNYVKSKLKCEKGHEFCSCGRPLHEGDCYKEDQAFKDLMIKENVKKCPKCGFLIKKNKGCNHITCGNPSCKYEFCWICMKESIPDHYKYGPCAGMQFIDPDSIIFMIKTKYPRIYCIYSIFECIYSFIICILFFFVAPSLLFILIAYKIMFGENRNRNNYIIPRKYCLHIMYFFTLSSIFICVQSIIYMIWILVLSAVSCCIFSCLLSCICHLIKPKRRHQLQNEVELENIPYNNV